MRYETLCVSNGNKYSKPIYMSNLYNGEYFYSRYGNPNKTELEARLKSLYRRDDKPCTVYPSGMSAIATLINYIREKYVKPIVLTPSDLYEEIREQILYFKDINFVQCDRNKIIENITDETSLIILESLTNPMLERYDIKSICNHKHNALVAVDNTILTSYYYNPFDDGVDIVIESLGKNTSGSGDVMAGALWGIEQSRFSILCGDMISPITCFMLQRNIPTLPIRMDRITESSKKVYEYLKTKTQYVKWSGMGGIITFSLVNDFNTDMVKDNLKLINCGTAFGYEETTIQAKYDGFGTVYPYPYNKHLRLSVGLEHPSDIIDDLKQAFERAGL